MAGTVHASLPGVPHLRTFADRSLRAEQSANAAVCQSRITTKYKISPPPSAESRKRKRKAAITDAKAETATQPDVASDAAQTPAKPQQPQATLTLKTFDPVSGVCLKYRTDKEREVGRLIASLGRLGRHMAALPDTDPPQDAAGSGTAGAGADVEMADASAAADGKPAATQSGSGQGGGGAGGGKKKKKGKR